MVIHRKKFLLRLGLWVGMWMCALASQAQEGTPQFLSRFNNTWVDSVFQKMSVDQKIGQLLMPRGNYSGKPHDLATLSRWVSEYHVGGIVFFASSPIEQAQVTNAVQSLARIPLFIGQDFE